MVDANQKPSKNEMCINQSNLSEFIGLHQSFHGVAPGYAITKLSLNVMCKKEIVKYLSHFLVPNSSKNTSLDDKYFKIQM